MDNQARSLEAQGTWNYAEEQREDSDSSYGGNPDSLVLSDPDLLDEDSSGIDTMEHMSG